MRVYLLRRVLPLSKKHTLFLLQNPNLHKRSYATRPSRVTFVASPRNILSPSSRAWRKFSFATFRAPTSKLSRSGSCFEAFARWLFRVASCAAISARTSILALSAFSGSPSLKPWGSAICLKCFLIWSLVTVHLRLTCQRSRASSPCSAIPKGGFRKSSVRLHQSRSAGFPHP